MGRHPWGQHYRLDKNGVLFLKVEQEIDHYNPDRLVAALINQVNPQFCHVLEILLELQNSTSELVFALAAYNIDLILAGVFGS